MLLSDPIKTIPHFHALRKKDGEGEGSQDEPYGPLVKCLSMEEEFAILGSLRILGVLIA
jgi:V-type H+-transporting ATPase subunit H